MPGGGSIINRSGSNGQAPRVSIGLPVHNGEDYLAQALDALLAQTYTGFELIIADNGSTDRTPEIARRYALRDARVRCLRSETNRGAAWNFNRVALAARGEYFKWAAHDDLVDPHFIEECVRALDAHPEAVLAYARVAIINAQGQAIEPYAVALRTGSADPLVRFRDLLIEWHLCFEVFGLIRLEMLKKTPLIGNYGHGDGILLERLALLGRFYEIPETLFYARKHARQSMNRFGVYAKGHNNYHQYTVWFDTHKAGKIIFPTWRMLAERLKTLKAAPLNGKQRCLAYLYLAKWVRRHREPLFFDLVIAGQQAAGKAGCHPETVHASGVDA